MTKISKIHARQIYDSRGNPTVEVDVTTNGGTFSACVPSGASTGIYEALEMRDGDQTKWLGKGVLNAVNNVNTKIANLLVNKELNLKDQTAIDNMMLKLDGTANKSVLGANAILGVSLAIARAAAAEQNIPLFQHLANLAGNEKIMLPVPAFNVINGGSHAENKLAMQEFMLLPYGVESFSAAMQCGSEIYQNLKLIIKKTYDLDFKSGDKSEMKDVDRYKTPIELGQLYKEFIKKYPIVSIEDPFDQDDWEGYVAFTEDVGQNIQVVGDDLLVTNPTRIQTALNNKACNALLL